MYAMPFGAADQQFHRVFDVHPAGGQRADDPAVELDQRLAGFVAIAVAAGDRMNFRRSPNRCRPAAT